MKSERSIWMGVAIGTVVAAALIGTGVPPTGTLVLTMVLLGLVFLTAGALARRQGSWLRPAIIGAFLVKLMGSAARLWVLQSVYRGVGDATVYHNRGLALAEIWRSLSVPALTQAGGGSTGTKIVAIITGLLYAPYKPSMLGGFFIFATVGFLGQILLLSAYRRSGLPHHKAYSIAVLFLPSLIFWPSSVGKESLMLFFIGLTAYGVARLLASYRFAPIVPIALGLGGAALIRPHVAVLLLGSLVVALFVVKAPSVPGAQIRRMVLIVGAGVGFLAVASLALHTLGLTPDPQEIDPFLTEIQRRTAQGGSAVTGTVVRSITQFPAGAATVLFRPFPFEAHNAQAMLSSIEGTLLLALIIWRLPRMLANLRFVRRRPFLVFSLVYVVVFTVAFSAFLNLGILARERTQVIPFVMALLVGMGWDEGSMSEDAVQTQEVAAP